MTMSYDRPAGARHTANAVPRLTPKSPTPVEVALRARIAELEAENGDLQKDKAELRAANAELKAANAELKAEGERLLATNTALWRKIAQQDRRLDALENNRGEYALFAGRTRPGDGRDDRPGLPSRAATAAAVASAAIGHPERPPRGTRQGAPVEGSIGMLRCVRHACGPLLCDLGD
jgi:hypothetical protein